MFDRWTVHAAPIRARGCLRQLDRAKSRGLHWHPQSRDHRWRIIEAHLRLSDQWPDLYGPAGPRPSSASIATGSGAMLTRPPRRYSIVLCGPWGRRYRHPPPALVQEVAGMPGVSSVQITFHEDRRRNGIPCRRGVPRGHRQRLRPGAGGGRARGAARPFPGRGARPQHPGAPIAYSRRLDARQRSIRAGRLIARRRRGGIGVDAGRGGGPRRFAKELADKLTPAQLAAYETYRAARDRSSGSSRSTGSGWRPSATRARPSACWGRSTSAEDYIAMQPPKYAGPELPPEIAKIVTEVKPPVPERPLATVADFLASAKEQYGFVPTPTTERDFKRRYARRRWPSVSARTRWCASTRSRPADKAPTTASGSIRHQAGPADLLGARLRAAPARQLDRASSSSTASRSRGA